MKSLEIEAWVLRVVDQVHKRQPHEDSRVELKSTWPDPEKAARQIAGHANAARGDYILWIIGLDESKGVVGVEEKELASWFLKVESCFDGLAPELTDLNVRIGKQTLVALLFSSDRAPFVVKNSVYGKQGAGSVELEVPWREGRRVRSARRIDLIRLLEPSIHKPTIEILSASVTVNVNEGNEDNVSYNWFVNASAYVVPVYGESIVIPFHKCNLRLKLDQIEIRDWKHFQLEPPELLKLLGRRSLISKKVDSLTIASTRSEVIIEGPGKLHLEADTQSSFFPKSSNSRMKLVAKLSPVGIPSPIILEQLLEPVSLNEEGRHLAKWEWISSP